MLCVPKPFHPWKENNPGESMQAGVLITCYACNLMAAFSTENHFGFRDCVRKGVNAPWFTCCSPFQFFPVSFLMWYRAERSIFSPMWLLHPKCLSSSFLFLEKQLSGFSKSSNILLWKETGRDWASFPGKKNVLMTVLWRMCFKLISWCYCRFFFWSLSWKKGRR